MKVKVKKILLALTPLGGALRLESEEYFLELYTVDPGIILSLDTVLNQRQAGERLPLPFILRKLIPAGKVKEVYINKLDTSTGAYSAEMKLENKTITVIPSAGILIAKIVGVPIYFNTKLAKPLATMAG
ncbi:MAG: hypothetical protein ACTSV6_05270 [Candidatus Heimdallarchaeota archaeon]